MVRLVLWTVAAAAVVAVGGCRSTTNVPIARGPVTTVAGSPAEVYSRVARQIRACWFKPSDPVLTKHVFRAEAAPDGSTTNLAIHEQTPEGRRGLKAFSVAFEPRGRNTSVTAQNHRMPYALGQVLVADVGRWASGNPICDAAQTRIAPRGSGDTPTGVAGRIYEPKAKPKGPFDGLR